MGSKCAYPLLSSYLSRRLGEGISVGIHIYPTTHVHIPLTAPTVLHPYWDRLNTGNIRGDYIKKSCICFGFLFEEYQKVALPRQQGGFSTIAASATFGSNIKQSRRWDKYSPACFSVSHSLLALLLDRQLR